MAGKTTVPFTAIENSSIARARQIGLASLGALVIIKSHLNQTTGQCNPSYNTLAKEAGVDRSTIIRYVKKLKAVNLIDPKLRFRDDGGYAANQYRFSMAGEHPAPQQPVKTDKLDRETDTEPPPAVADPPPPGGTTASPPGGTDANTPSGNFATSLKNKTKERTSEPVTPLPTEKQKSCSHPLLEIGYLRADNIRICYHCWGRLDENLRLIIEGSVESEVLKNMASAECEPLGEPETKQPPVGEILTKMSESTIPGDSNVVTTPKTALETPLKMAWKSRQIAPEGGKAGKNTNLLVMLGKLILEALKAS